MSDRLPSFSLFFFSDDRPRKADRYRLVVDAARFADERGFDSVWVPERHFNKFGALYPNPSVLAAAVAAVTGRVGIRAGSVVVPLHHPVRIAEEWAMVDNLSNGRAGIAAASGWAEADFVLSDADYGRRRQETFDRLDIVRRLWRGERVDAGAELQRGYRAARARGGHDPAAGRVTVMIHTFIGDDPDEVRRIVREPMISYIQTHLSQNEPRNGSPEALREARARLAEFAFERYFTSTGLFGTVETALARVARLTDAGIDEIACLIDFGVDDEVVLDGLSYIDALRRAAAEPARA